MIRAKEGREVLRLLREDGWALVRQRVSHRHFQHPQKPGTVTVGGHEGDDLHLKTEDSILAQAGLKPRRK